LIGLKIGGSYWLHNFGWRVFELFV